uniref:Uncharacterized protein n=1 Tax=Arundo donax TaxID=35708 RepID=A0A0A9DZP0_ARUDO
MAPPPSARAPAWGTSPSSPPDPPAAVRPRPTDPTAPASPTPAATPPTTSSRGPPPPAASARRVFLGLKKNTGGFCLDYKSLEKVIGEESLVILWFPEHLLK